ncbi:hypothetical protein B0H14DRAFT_2628546 [Mycena olivaceomarginata]|nr:hypothetical protein B0H14DRAFT_2628546 [Mycena olivaceomarginata]
MARTKAETKVELVASTGLATKDGLITDQTPSSIMAKTNLVFAVNKPWSLAIKPGGNFALVGWKAPSLIPISFDSGFLYPHLAEYAISGCPVSWDTAVDIHTALDKCFEMFASVLEDVVKKKKHEQSQPMFILNATTMDEGRFSDFDDVYGLLPLLSDPDICFNRVPEVLIFNATTKEYSPMSFHLLHRLGTGVVLNTMIAPMAYEHGRKLGWEYRLINITVMGRCEDDTLSSPSKFVVKHKAILIDLDDLSDERPNPKRSAGGSKASDDKRACEGSKVVGSSHT